MYRNTFLRRKQLKRDYVQKLKTETPCTDCGIRYHYSVMDFDHVRGEKRYPVSKIVAANIGFDYLLEELEKCDVVCANCHRLRTFARKVWMRPSESPKRIYGGQAKSDEKLVTC